MEFRNYISVAWVPLVLFNGILDERFAMRLPSSLHLGLLAGQSGSSSGLVFL